MSSIWIQPSEMEARQKQRQYNWDMVLLVNSRGKVCEFPEPRAKQLLDGVEFREAPKGSKLGDYLPAFDAKVPLKSVEPEPAPPKKKATSKKKK